MVRSFIAVGTPYNGEVESRTDAAADLARRRARSPVTVTNAPTSSESRSMRSR